MRDRSNRSGGRSRAPWLALMVAVVAVLSGALAITETAHPAAPAAPALASPASIAGSSAARSAGTPAVAHPDGISATVLDTISTLNGTTRPGAHEYSGGYFVTNMTVVGDRVFAAGEYGGTVLVVNATSGALVSAPSWGGFPIATAYDTSNGEVYVVGTGSQLVALDAISGAILSETPLVIPGGYPDGLAFDASTGLLLAAVVADGSSSTPGALDFVDPASGAVVARTPVGGVPTEIAVDPASNEAYVVNTFTDNISVVSLTTHAVIATLVPTAGGPAAVEYDASNGDVYVSLSAGAIEVLNGSTSAVVTTVTLTGPPGGETLVPSSGLLAVVGVEGTVWEIYTSNDTLARTFPLPFFPIIGYGSGPTESLVYSVAAGRLYLPGGNNDLVGFNLTGSEVADTSFGDQPFAEVVDPVNGMLYVVDTTTSNLTVINLRTYEVITTIVLGENNVAEGITYDAVSNLLVVACEDGPAILVDPSTDLVVGTVAVGYLGLQAVYSNVTDRVYVVNYGSNNVSVLGGSTDALVGTINLPAPPAGTLAYLEGEALGGTGTVLYLADIVYNFTALDWETTVYPVDLASDAVGASIASWVGDSYTLNIDPVSNDLFAGYYNTTGFPTVAVVNATTGSLVTTRLDEAIDGAGSWDPAAGFLALPDFIPNQLELFGDDPAVPVAAITVGEGPVAVAFDPTSGDLDVLNEAGSSVSVVAVGVSPDSVALATDPAVCGPFQFNGGAAPGNTIVPNGEYAAVASTACWGYAFQGWNATGGIGLLDGNLATNLVRVSGNGTLTAEYALIPGAQFGVSVAVSPTSCGDVVTVAGSAYGSGEVAQLTYGSNTPVVAGACGGYAFAAWSSTGGVSIVASGPSGGTMSVDGNGTLTATYVVSTATAPSGSSSTGVSTGELYALVAAGVLGGALVGVLVGRRGPARPAPAPNAPPPGPSGPPPGIH